MNIYSLCYLCPLKDERNDRISRPDVFCKRGVLTTFAKFTGKHLR